MANYDFDSIMREALEVLGQLPDDDNEQSRSVFSNRTGQRGSLKMLSSELNLSERGQQRVNLSGSSPTKTEEEASKAQEDDLAQIIDELISSYEN